MIVPIDSSTESRPHLESIADRKLAGKVRRNAVPRKSHSGWRTPKDRCDPIAIIEASNSGRLPELIPLRHGRMLESPFAFFRGNAGLMASDLCRTPASGIDVQVCGDAHLLNFGGFATPERNLVFDLNDFDETIQAPFEWDVKRLASSIVIAGRHLGISDNHLMDATRHAIGAYRAKMLEYSVMPVLQVWYDKITVDWLLEHAPKDFCRDRLRKRIARAKARSAMLDDFPKLAERVGDRHAIKDNPPTIYHPTAELAPGYTEHFRTALAGYRESLPHGTRALLDRFHFCDFAIKVVGVGSVGMACGVMLMMASENDPLFLQVKEARPSALEPYYVKSPHTNQGQRIVEGQRLMQSASDLFLGWSIGLTGQHFYVRQLRDMKLSAILDDWDCEVLEVYGAACAAVLARAHARSCDPAEIAGYLGTSNAFDTAISEFAIDYAGQNERDYGAFERAIQDGRLERTIENID